ncbi:MAG: YceI family protein [Daejeonella sp.]
MKKFLFVSFLFFSNILLYAQQGIYSTSSGKMSFFSKAPLEDINARNDKVFSQLNTSNKEIAVKVPVRQFFFSNKLMQEHFNENYMESRRFPYATFKGKINEDIDFSKTGTYDVSASGILNVHGVNQKRTFKGTLKVAPNSIVLDTHFDVKLQDHKIKIPRLVFNKIAEVISVSSSLNYSQSEK